MIEPDGRSPTIWPRETLYPRVCNDHVNLCGKTIGNAVAPSRHLGLKRIKFAPSLWPDNAILRNARGALKAPDTSICHWPKITISRQTQDALHLSNGWAAITFLERRPRNRWCWRPRPPASFCHPPPPAPGAYRVCTGPRKKNRKKKNGKTKRNRYLSFSLAVSRPVRHIDIAS